MAQNTVTAQAGRKPKKQKQSQFSGMSRALVRRETISAYLFLLPSLIFFVTFVVVPMFICLFYSFTKYGLGGIKGFAGLENYIKLCVLPAGGHRIGGHHGSVEVDSESLQRHP